MPLKVVVVVVVVDLEVVGASMARGVSKRDLSRLRVGEEARLAAREWIEVGAGWEVSWAMKGRGRVIFGWGCLWIF